MDEREELELKWREEFDKLGEEGVRHEFFKGSIQTDRRKEGFAYRWLGEKRQEQEKKKTDRKHRIMWAILVVIGILILAAAAFQYFGKR